MIAPEPIEPIRIWTSCCLRIDQSMCVYVSQMLMTSAVLSFCFYMLSKSDFDCQKSSAYWACVSMCLGLILGRASNKITTNV
jgi:hypothetical protein